MMDGPDGERLLMVTMELLMSLFALLYAFPHVPSRLLDRADDGGTFWKAVPGGPLDDRARPAASDGPSFPP